MAEVLERIGCAVDFPEAQTCCGQPAFNSGFREEARQVARHFLSVFANAEYVVVPSGSCASMISHHFADIFEKEPGTLETIRAMSSNGTANGIVWAFTTANPSTLYAYDATNLGTQLYNSSQATGGRDNFGVGNKLNAAVVVGGKVFVPTTTGVAEFGLLQ